MGIDRLVVDSRGGVRRAGGRTMTPLRAKGLFLRLSGALSVRNVSEAGRNGIYGTGQSTHCGRPLAAAVTAVVVVFVKRAIDDAVGTVFTHPLAENLEENGTLEAHLANATNEAVFAEAVGVVVLFDFVHASFQLNALFLVGCFYGRRESRSIGPCGGD